MKKIFLDTNVLLDFILDREGEQLTADILQLGEDKKIELYVSYLTMANAAYVARKHRTREELYAYLSELTDMVRILPNDEEQYHQALCHQASDFEDYLQCICAQTFNCDIIITNNVKHFADAKLPVMNPKEFLIHMAFF